MKKNRWDPTYLPEFVAYELHKEAHKHFMDLGYYLIGNSFTTDDYSGIEECIIASYLGYTDIMELEEVTA